MVGKDLVPRPFEPPAEVDKPPWQGNRQLKSEAAYRTILRWARRDRHYTVPLAVPFVLWPAAAILHEFRSAGFVLLAGAIITAMTAYFARHKWDRTSERWYASASAASASLWLWLATWLGPLRTGLTAIVLAAMLFAGTVAWAVPWYRHKRPRGHRRRQKRIAKWDAWWQSHAWDWNLGGSKVIEVWEMGLTTRVRIQGVPGRHSKQHIEQVMPLIESSVEGLADIGMIRHEAVKGNPSRFDLFFKRENPLAQVVEYDGAMAPQSVHDDYPMGMAETGEWRRIPLRCNRFTIGESRSGKSNDLLVGLAALTGCPDDRQILIDLKGGRSARPVLAASAVDYVVTEVDEARMVLHMLVAEDKARAKNAYVDEEEQLRATIEIPAIHLLIDETHGLTSVANGDAECSRLLATHTSQGMGLEEYVWVYTQHGSLEESVRTEQTRGNLGVRTVYRVAEARHGAYVIPEYAKLDASKLEEKGTCYIKDGPKAFAEQVRAPKMSHVMLKKIAAQNAAMVAGRPSLRLYCGNEMSPAGVTWQEWWDTRWQRLDEAFRNESPQYRAAVADHPRAAVQVLRDAADTIEPVPQSVPGEGTGREVQAQIDAEINALRDAIPDDFRPSPDVVARMPQAARTQKDRFADALAAASPGAGITPKTLMAESGMSNSWIHQMLTSLTDLDAVTKLRRGVYAPRPGADIAASIALVEARNDQLLRQARKDNGGRRLTPVA